MNPQSPRLSPHVFKYRVMKGEEILGQFSSLDLAIETARQHRGIPVVLDVSVQPPLIIYRRGQLLEPETGKPTPEAQGEPDQPERKDPTRPKDDAPNAEDLGLGDQGQSGG